MPIEYEKDTVIFRDDVSVEEAEGLLERLHKNCSANVDMSACTHLHPANLQVLMAARAHVTGWPERADLCAWLETALKAELGEDSSCPKPF
jgi:hypothetical protein